MERFLLSLIQNRLMILLAFLVVLAGGILAFQNLRIDAFPDLTNNQVQVITEAPGYAPEETEQLVTIPVESMMSGLPRVTLVRSISKFGLSVVTVVFDDAMDVYFARQLVNERLQLSRSRLPEEMTPEMGPITTGMGEIYQYVLRGAGYTATELKTLHDWEVKYRLRTVPGVNEVNSWGGYTQEYHVVIDPKQLLRYQLTLQEVFDALKNNNANFGGGILQHHSEQYVIRGMGRVQSLQDIENIVVKTVYHQPVFIKNLAQVKIGHSLRQGGVTQDGEGEVVTGMVMMLKGENSRAVIDRVKTKVRDIQDTLPEGVRIQPYYDQTRLIEETLKTVETNLLEGGMLVIAVLLFMLGNLRAALIVAAVIPLSLMFSFMGMQVLGISANIMSLGAIDFGMIVDGAIVMAEDIIRKLSYRDERENQFTSRLSLIQQSVREMAKPILFGVLIITIVYMPILALEGMEYKMFSPMVFTITFALLGSLLCALVLVPVLCSFVLKGHVQDRENILVETLKPRYLNILNTLMHRKALTISLTVIVFLGALAFIPFLGSEFVPELDERDILIEVRNLTTVSLPHALETSTQAEMLLKQFPEVKTVVSKTGRPDLATDPMGVYATDMFVILKPAEAWRSGIDKEALIQRMRSVLTRNLPGIQLSFTQPIAMRVDELVSGVRSDVAIKLFGPDLNILSQKAAEIQTAMARVNGVTDLQVSKLGHSGSLYVVPDRQKMALFGVNVAQIRQLVETAVVGHPVTEVIEGQKRFTVRAIFPEDERRVPEQLSTLFINTPDKGPVRLGQVARVVQAEGTDVIQRELLQRLTTVQMNVENRDVGSFVAEGMEALSDQVSLPPGYYLEWSGQFENQQRAMERLTLIVPLSILVIFLLLMGMFRSLPNTLLVMLNVPFALVGGIFALWARGMYFSVPAAIGFIALFGVAVLNGLVLISTIQRNLQEGIPLQQAILQGAQTRLRPVLMTAMVAALGFLPMALSAGTGAEVQKPLATVVIGGLVSSTLLTLIVLPVIYYWVHQRIRSTQQTSLTP